jgi:allantoin racemase
MPTKWRKITRIAPIPVPPDALDMFVAQISPAFKREDIKLEFVPTRGGARILDSYCEMTLADALVLGAGNGRHIFQCPTINSKGPS